jgi:hypothetical protein
MLPPQGLLPPFELSSTSAQAEHHIPQFVTPADLHRPSHSVDFMGEPDNFLGRTNLGRCLTDQLFDAGQFVGGAEPLFQTLNSPEHWVSLDSSEGEWSSAHLPMRRLLLGQPASPESSGEQPLPAREADVEMLCESS